MASAQLNRALDSADSQTAERQPLQGSLQEAETDSEQQPQAGHPELYVEHMARVRAEGEAEDYSRRLAVAQEQLAEYAAQKEQDAVVLLQQAQALQASVAQAAAQAGGGAVDLQALQASADQLARQMADAAGEARNFAAQQQADVEHSKRSSVQAGLPEANGHPDHKRMREDANGLTPQANGSHAQQEDGSMEADMEADDDEPSTSTAVPAAIALGASSFAERARYIPLRLQMPERRLLRLLEAALSVSEYTDKVDVLTWRSKTAQIHAQIKDICAILSGLVVAQDYKEGQRLVQDRNFQDNAEFFQAVFEVGRRFKIMNPDRMRSEYGKLVYMLMDSANDQVQSLLEFKCVQPLRTVHALLEEADGLALLEDPLMETATAEIVAGSRARRDIQADIRRKERARDVLARRYRSAQLGEESILQCLYSISDNNSFLLFNRDPVDKMIGYLEHYFDPRVPQQGYSLSISGGSNGARLTHNHERQYQYVLQSLTLWREISHEMFKLWYLAESDLLREGNTYRLQNTGQGLQRVQQAPAISKAMHSLLWRCQQRIGHWVGSSVIHLGDHNVPNALMFIDKYTQVPRILNPVVLVVEQLPKLCEDAQLHAYVQQTFGSIDGCRLQILLDFFRHAFDGGGADNFFDAGSCIDGRLTSAWNWGSKIERKPYYPVFRLAGFSSFDGDWK